ncbi:hypothetical protein [Paenibacillus sp. OV219]|uniref:hypothetical protein n=1 Tax=Paenibacillus sp. OV219 TaxID=1884377 RepID=UPI0008BDD42C|nr:hypothetical protein [Paenibacillus sp. OV219]SEO60893.1 hypothetical protein SAMN05518847_10915 [Paenibacillus sp. OV219]
MSVLVFDMKVSVPSSGQGPGVPIPVGFISTTPTDDKYTIADGFFQADVGLYAEFFPLNNRIVLTAMLGVLGTGGNGEIIVKLFKSLDSTSIGVEIADTRIGFESGLERYYTIELQTADFNTDSSFNVYNLTAELEPIEETSASVIGPISLVGVFYGPVL